MTRKEEEEHLYKRSSEFLETAFFQLDRGFYALTVFNAEQSLHLFLKAKLLEEGLPYPQTHGVRSLMELLSTITEEDKTGKEVSKLLELYLIELGSLEDAYIASRYLLREYKREEAERLLEVVKEIRDAL
ncbi:HEPN domain-containing protein [Candidatus Bathyarchaeota archaeon]|nr:HEPN domain-containing protein [Candidatus Bathyarchaeota archaeon]